MLLADLQTETFDHLVYDGAVGWPGMIAALVAFLALLVWLSVRERGVTGNRLAGFFLMIRLTAVGFVFWMLLGPTHVVTKRSTLPKEAALLLDVSDSMQETASLNVVDSLRWRHAAGLASDSLGEMLAAIDRATVAIWFAERNATLAANAGGALASEEFVGDPLRAVRTALEESRDCLDEAAGAGFDSELSQDAKELADKLRERGLPAVAEVLNLLRSERVSVDLVVQAINGLHEETSAWRRRAEALQRSLVALAADEIDGASYGSLADLSRHELASRVLDRVEREIAEGPEVETILRRLTVDQAVAPLSDDLSWDQALLTAGSSRGKVTNLSAPWQNLREQSPGGALTTAVLLSDGSHNDVMAPSPVTAAASVGVPVFTAALASGQQQRDVSVYRVNAPRTIALNDEVVAEAIVSGVQVEGERVEVALLSDGKVVDRQQVDFTGSRQDQRVRLTARAELLGRHEYELTVSALPFEATTDNNTAGFAVRTVLDKIRVVLADRIANWEFRYLDQLWRRDPRVEYDRFLLLPKLQASGALSQTKELPRRVEGWSRYDVAVLGDLDPSALDQQQQEALADWVNDRGGTIVVIAGSRSMPDAYASSPLAKLLPVELNSRSAEKSLGFGARVNDGSAELDPVFLADEAYESAELWRKQYRTRPIYGLSAWTRLKPSAQAMLVAAPLEVPGKGADVPPTPATRALLSWQSVGAGRVVFLSAPATWHLRYRQGDKLHHRFWGQMLRWLTEPLRGAGDSDVFVGVSSSLIEFGERLEATVTIAPNRLLESESRVSLAAVPTAGNPIVVDLTPDAKNPGRFSAEFERLPPGSYRIRVEGLSPSDQPNNESEANSTTVVTVSPPRQRESLELGGNRPLLREMAAVSGGCELPPTALAEAIRLTASAPRVTEESTRTPLWNRWRYFWIITGCLATEWSLRRWIGLI